MLTRLAKLAGDTSNIEFVATEHPALQPGQAATIMRDGQKLGVMGKLHPRHVEVLRTQARRISCLSWMRQRRLHQQHPKQFPCRSFHRFVVTLPWLSTTRSRRTNSSRRSRRAAPDLISSVRIFDIYKGPGIEAGLKSVALGLILQETSRTLTDDDADAAMAAAVRKLQDKFGGELRD